jgi:hypothetical protein
MFLAYDPATSPINTIEWLFPFFECIHIAALAFTIGTVGLVDLRMLGAGITARTPAQLVRDTDLWTLIGLASVITSGMALFMSDPVMYSHNHPFVLKMVVLLVAILFHYVLLRRVALRDSKGTSAALAAAISIALWLTVIFSGIFIAFW